MFPSEPIRRYLRRVILIFAHQSAAAIQSNKAMILNTSSNTNIARRYPRFQCVDWNPRSQPAAS